MEKFMEHELQSFHLVGDVIRREVDLPVARPAGSHDRAWIAKTGSGSIPEHLRLNYRTKPQRIRDFFSHLLGQLRGNLLSRHDR